MRPSLRFLGVALIGWAGLRAATLGALPGYELFQIKPSEARVPPLTATEFPPIDPPPAAGDMTFAAYDHGAASEGMAVAAARRLAIPIHYAAISRPAVFGASPAALPHPGYQFDAGAPAFAELPYSRLAAASYPPLQSAVAVPGQSRPAEALKSDRFDRLQLSAWALLRPPSAGVAGSRSLAAGGSLGASQAGARLTYHFTRQLAATFRSSTEVGRRGGEIAAGLRAQPLSGIPLWINAERRQRIGRFGGGRNAFALFVEGGIYDRPMPLSFMLDGYLQAGVVGARRRDPFIDGAFTLTRPVYKQFSAGFGLWGGAQPGLTRLDAGPRVTMRVRPNLRVHADWRQQVAGNALPKSGPAITLAGDF